MHIIKTIIAAMLLNIAVFTQGQKCTETPVLLDPVFNKSIELSAIAWAGDNVYMPTAKCGLVFIGKIEGQNMTYREQPIKKRNYEGMAFWNSHFYLSHDSNPVVYVYNRAFKQTGSTSN